MAETHVIRVMAVDDHPLMMAGIVGEINAQTDMRVVAQASDGDEAVALFRQHRPDVTLMDIRMPKVNGIAAISSIHQQFPHARIVVLTTAADDAITNRELDVLRGVANGNSNKIIASDLNISEHTVKNHLKSILSKLNASDRTHAVMIALKRGFLDM